MRSRRGRCAGKAIARAYDCPEHPRRRPARNLIAVRRREYSRQVARDLSAATSRLSAAEIQPSGCARFVGRNLTAVRGGDTAVRLRAICRPQPHGWPRRREQQ
ncbi:hypothetical protein ACFPM0_19955 [Pseudonocardia sulfidoxydans]|uniref:hypothetical protein n=1 Tax=Pseudonocardia sulfidoxydans TaxID=54011 RepID=UPI00361D6DB5